MSLYTIIGHTKNADYVFEIEAAYHTDAMVEVKNNLLTMGFLYGEFTVEFLTDAEAAEFYAASVAALSLAA